MAPYGGNPAKASGSGRSPGSPCAGTGSAFQCSSVIVMPIWVASAAPSFLVPLGRVGEEPLLVDVEFVAVECRHGHSELSSYVVLVLTVVFPTMDM